MPTFRPIARFRPPATIAAARLAVAWALLTAFAWNLPLNNDIAWQYWVARQVIGGARLYHDIAESNPPLWFWEAIPLTRAADAFGILPSHLAVAAVMARIVLAAGMVGALVDRRAGMYRVAAVTVLTALGAFSFGERDGLMAIGALPYAMLAARRADGVPTDRALALAVALLAAWGFALKPHFVLVPLLLEGWLAYRLRREWRPLRAETLALCAVAAGYCTAVVAFAPAYLTEQLPLVLSAYGEFRPPFAALWTGQAYAVVWLTGTAALLVARRRPAAVAASGVNACACLLIYAWQGKGFAYHATPVTIALVWTAFLLLATTHRLLPRLLAWLTLATAMTIAAFVGPFQPARLGGITPLLNALPAGAGFALVSAHSWNAFPLVEQRRLVWPLRGLLLWTLPTIARTGPDTPLARRVRGEIATDLWCHPPDVILFDDPRRSPAMPHDGRFDYRTFLLADPAMRDLLAAYRPVAREAGATLWRRYLPIPPRGAACRTISIRPAAPAEGSILDMFSPFRAPGPDMPRTASPPAG